MGYAGTKNVPAAVAARALSWVETDNHGSALIAPLGVKTLLYTNPNRVQPRDPLGNGPENAYAHLCSGDRVLGETNYTGQVLTNPGSPALKAMWRKSVADHEEGGHFDAVFADEADGALYAAEQPCGYSLKSWIAQEQQLFASLGQPVIYNGLNDFNGHGVAPEIALNRTAAGGMMEQCYAQLDAPHRVGGWKWWATEETELRMAQQHKYFFCYGRDLRPADQADASRMYVFASYLLTYDPHTSVLWEYYKTPSGGHVMPESTLVALDPVTRIDQVTQLRARGGTFVRIYRRCYLAGRAVGECAAAVNPDDGEHAVNLPGFTRTLVLHGSGIFDGGSAEIVSMPPPRELEPRGAVIAFR